MLKITQQQIESLNESEFRLVAARVSAEWPATHARLYSERTEISESNRRYWIDRTTNACQRWDLDSENAIISLATNVLSAATLGLSTQFIENMSAYFLACAANESDFTLAQDWIAWVLFEQHELLRRRANAVAI